MSMDFDRFRKNASGKQAPATRQSVSEGATQLLARYNRSWTPAQTDFLDELLSLPLC